MKEIEVTHNDVSKELFNAMKIQLDVMKRFDPECAAELEKIINKLAPHFEPVNITVDMVLKLRQHTGEGMMSCNKALRHCNGNLEEAVDYLKRAGTLCI